MLNKEAFADHLRTIAPGWIEGLSHAERLHWIADHAPSFFCGKPSWVYFIGCTAAAIKIGMGTNVPARLREIQSCCPIRVTTLAQLPGGRAREHAYHKQFADHLLHGEWFSPHPDILAEIDRLNAIWETPHEAS
jgi:hypothetical protein